MDNGRSVQSHYFLDGTANTSTVLSQPKASILQMDSQQPVEAIASVISTYASGVDNLPPVYAAESQKRASIQETSQLRHDYFVAQSTDGINVNHYGEHRQILEVPQVVADDYFTRSNVYQENEYEVLRREMANLDCTTARGPQTAPSSPMPMKSRFNREITIGDCHTARGMFDSPATTAHGFDLDISGMDTALTMHQGAAFDPIHMVAESRYELEALNE